MKNLTGLILILILAGLVSIGSFIENQTNPELFINTRKEINISALQINTYLANADASFIGENEYDLAGVSLAGIGDVNGDNIDDFLIGASQYNVSSGNEGKVYLFFGNNTNSWSTGMSCSKANASFIGESEDDYAGCAVAGAGDVNKDGYDDFLIGASGGDDFNKPGKVYLIFGRDYGWGKDINLANANASFLGEANGDHAGSSVAGAGDVNGDGYDDFLIGAYNASTNNAGKTYLFFGNDTNSWSSGISCSEANASFIGEAAGDVSGHSIAGAGDINRDGYDDFLIGAPENDDGGSAAGKTYLFFGTNETIWSTGMSCSEANASFEGEIFSIRSGYAVAGVGDVNGDNYDDFIIGAPQYEASIDKEGKTYLFFGNDTNSWSSGMNCSQANASFIGEDEGDYSGNAVAGAGDVDGDGYGDFLIGAYRYNHSSDVDIGKTYLIFGQKTGWLMDVNLENAGASFIGETSYDYSGQTLAGAGDVNGDGYDDLLIGAYRDDNIAGVDAGQSYLIFGESALTLQMPLALLFLPSPEGEQIPVYPPLIILPIAVSTIIAILYLNKRKRFIYN